MSKDWYYENFFHAQLPYVKKWANFISILSHYGKYSSFLKFPISINRIIVSVGEKRNSEEKILVHIVNFASMFWTLYVVLESHFPF